MKIGILPWEKYEGRKNIGSSRIRARWIAKYWDDAEIFKQGQKYDVVIYQKCYWVEHAKINNDCLKILDLCDPDWLHFAYRIVETLEECDGVTTSTEELAKEVRQFTDKPVLCVPDRLDLEEFKQKKVHHDKAKEVVWYGYAQNYDLLDTAIRFIVKNNLDLIVVSDKNYQVQANYQGTLRVTNFKWEPETINDNILRGDIVINPVSKAGKWRFKSNNKTTMAWAIGMPVASTVEDLVGFIEADARKEEVEKRLKEVQEKYDVKISVEELKQFINEIREHKTKTNKEDTGK